MGFCTNRFFCLQMQSVWEQKKVVTHHIRAIFYGLVARSSSREKNDSLATDGSEETSWSKYVALGKAVLPERGLNKVGLVNIEIFRSLSPRATCAFDRCSDHLLPTNAPACAVSSFS